jgi:putative membrane protein
VPILIPLLLAWATNILALWVANGLLSGLVITSTAGYVIGALVLGFANGVLRPILTILTLPLVIFTLGLFLLLINIGMVALAAWIAPDFTIHGFWTYVGTILIVWLVNWAVGAFVQRASRQWRRQTFPQ